MQYITLQYMYITVLETDVSPVSNGNVGLFVIRCKTTCGCDELCYLIFISVVPQLTSNRPISLV